MSRISIALALMGGATLLAGCFNTVEPGTGPAKAELLEGSMGGVQDFTGDPTLHQAWASEGDSYVELRTQGEDWAVMTGFNLFGLLGEGNLAPGARIQISGIDGEFDPAGASMIACSGPTEDEWNWDCPPDQALLAIEAGPEPGTLELSFEATFGENCAGGPGGPGLPPPPIDPGGDPMDPPPPIDPTDPGEPTEPFDPGYEPPTYDGPQDVRGRIIIDLADIEDAPYGDVGMPGDGFLPPPPEEEPPPGF